MIAKVIVPIARAVVLTLAFATLAVPAGAQQPSPATLDAARQLMEIKGVKGLVEPVMLPTKKKYPNVVRGGSWDDEAKRVRCAARQASNPDWNFQDPQRPQSIWWLTDGTFVGFRVVRPVADEEKLKGVKSLVKKYDF